MNDYYLWISSIHFAVFKTPKNVASSIPAKADVKSFNVSKMLFPFCRSIVSANCCITSPEMSDRIANKNNVRIHILLLFKDTFMALIPIVAVVLKFFLRNKCHIAAIFLNESFDDCRCIFTN